jgi:hypothetical protein
MFKKEKDGKTNINLQKGGINIGFSFCVYINYNNNNYIDFFKNKNTNYRL